jgi:RNA polymerase sigma-70 factor (ECF subfamily)
MAQGPAFTRGTRTAARSRPEKPWTRSFCRLPVCGAPCARGTAFTVQEAVNEAEEGEEGGDPYQSERAAAPNYRRSLFGWHGSEVTGPRPAHTVEESRVKEAVFIGGPAPAGPDLQELLAHVARGDQDAFSRVYDLVCGPVLGLVRSVLRDPAQSEEVAQEVLLEVWRSAARFQPSRGSGMTWVLTLAHRRAVDRVRSAQASSDREHRAALLDQSPAFDQVTEQVESNLEREQVRRCLRTLTELQRQSVTMAYYQGLAYREVAELLSVPLGTVKTRLRDGLIRLRDCLGVSA